MLVILNGVVAVGTVLLLPVVVMYFTALHHFGTSLRAKHPDIYAQVAGGHLAPFASSYAALQKLRADKSLVDKLDPLVATRMRDAYRYLVISMSCLMVVLLAGLGNSLIAKA